MGHSEHSKRFLFSKGFGISVVLTIEMLYSYFPLLLLTLAHLTQLTIASVCVVSHWSEWSECFGNCNYGEKVRNRRVTRPPFPERNALGMTVLRECPHLYDIDFCIPPVCLRKNNLIDELISEMQGSQSATNEGHYAIDQPESLGNNPTDSTTTIMQAQRPTERTDKQLIKSPKTVAVELTRMTNLEKLYKENKQKILNAGENIKGQSIFKLNANNSGVFCTNANRRCCRVQRRLCPDGAKAQLVTRWFRKSGESSCRSYQYPYCGIEVEAADRPIKYEENCLDLCFSIDEKRRHPLFSQYPIV